MNRSAASLSKIVSKLKLAHFVFLGLVFAGGVEGALLDQDILAGIIVVGSSSLNHQLAIFVVDLRLQEGFALACGWVPIVVGGQVDCREGHHKQQENQHFHLKIISNQI